MKRSSHTILTDVSPACVSASSTSPDVTVESLLSATGEVPPRIAFIVSRLANWRPLRNQQTLTRIPTSTILNDYRQEPIKSSNHWKALDIARRCQCFGSKHFSPLTASPGQRKQIAETTNVSPVSTWDQKARPSRQIPWTLSYRINLPITYASALAKTRLPACASL